MIRFAANVQRIGDGGHPVLHQVAGESTDDAADKNDERNFVVMETNLFGEAFDGKWAVGVDFLVTGLMRLPRRVNQSLSRVKLRHGAVDGIALHSACTSALTSAWGRSVRISKMEIIGSTRTNKKMAARNMPMVPM